jgi:signal transduction histidine kinase
MTVFSLIGQLAPPETRASAARSLAQALGAEDLLLFLRDPEVDVLLPAPGFAQTLRGGAEWRAFLAECETHGSATGRMASPGRDAELDAWAYRVETNSVVVLLGGRPDDANVREILPLFCLVAAVASRESRMRSLEANARMAATAATQGEVLARALERSRDQIRDALTSAREANRLVAQQAERIAAVAADAERARASAEEANRTKSGFLAMMSHELRTPLNAIGGYTGLLEEGIMGPLVAGQREYLGRIKRAQMHLLALINDVLNFAKSESGTISYDIMPLDLRAVLAGVAALIEPMAATRGVEYDYAPPDSEVIALGDRDKIVQVVLNLLTNAVKFTRPGGIVRLRVALTEHSAQIMVADSGPGIPGEQCASIFEPFVQLERSFAGEREGVGLGLSISRELARGMGGDIDVQSEVGQGSTFTFVLPRPMD